MFEKIEFWFNCLQFRYLHRAQFYWDLSRTMEVAKGKNLKHLLTTQADRYPKEPTGILCRLWVNRLENEVGTFADAIRGTVPMQDQTLLEVCEEAGDLQYGLKALGSNLLALKSTTKNVMAIMGLVFLMFILLHIYFFGQAFYLIPMTFEGSQYMDLTKIGPNTRFALAVEYIFKTWGWAIVAGEIGIAWIIFWSLDNYTGRFRGWLDKYFLPHQIYRCFNAAAFISTLAAITQRIGGGGNVVAMQKALEKIHEHSFPWLRQQTEKILNNLDSNPNGKGEVFNTGLLDKQIYYRVLDLGDSEEDSSKLLAQIAAIILEETPNRTAIRVMIVRFILVISIVSIIVFFFFSTQGISDELTRAMQTDI